jgi:hypothetical protein
VCEPLVSWVVLQLAVPADAFQEIVQPGIGWLFSVKLTGPVSATG